MIIIIIYVTMICNQVGAALAKLDKVYLMRNKVSLYFFDLHKIKTKVRL